MSTPPLPAPKDLPFGPGPVTYLIQLPEKKPSALGAFLRRFFVAVFLILFLFTIGLLLLLLGSLTEGSLDEKHYAGTVTDTNKVAIVRVDGVLMEGMTEYVTKQLKTAAHDDHVKAVVLQINSPGGTVTASDQLYHHVLDLKEGKWPKQSAPKPVVVQMTSIAASGGYYIAAPANTIYAEETTLTGSIGVYASLFNVHKLAEKHGVEFKMFAKGELKGSGSPFYPMTAEQEHEWSEMLEHTYQHFQKIVNAGRGPKLKYKLRDPIELTDSKGQKYTRRLADGGVFTAEQALKFGLIDKIGRLRDAITEAQTLAGLSHSKVITYAKPVTVMDALLGVKTSEPPSVQLDQVPGMSARIWYLTPGYELSGVKVPLSP
jgi:protease-4